MTVLPRLNPARGSADDEDARRWERVRILETGLGYSNLALEVAPNKQTFEDGHSCWHTNEDEFRGHLRNKRFSGIDTAPRFQGLAPQQDFVNGGSVPALTKPSKGQLASAPWTQPVSGRAVARGNLPPVPVPPKETTTNWAPAEPLNTGVSAGSLDKLCGDRHPSPCSKAMQYASHVEEMTVRERLNGCQSLHGVSMKNSADISVPNARRSSGSPTGQAKASAGSDPATRQANCVGDPSLEGATSRANSAGDASAWPSEVFAAADNRSSVAPHHFGRGDEQTGKVAAKNAAATGSDVQRVIIVASSSRQKLRTVRSGSCRSLLSPKNPLTSNTVVARVKQGMQNGGEKRPKALLVGSGTFNPVHKLHIRKFYLARNFLEAHKGVSSVHQLFYYRYISIFWRSSMYMRHK